MKNEKTIIWDWNGTLLDDAEMCVASINTMLKERKLTELSLAAYRDIFTFPVIEYYKKAGFDFTAELWEPVAMQFMNLYFRALPACRLTYEAKETLDFFKNRGFGQAIISAMQHDALIESVGNLNISNYFSYIGGIGDHYGGGKVENARNYFEKAGLIPQHVTLVGDTIHDSEVANELQINCVLLASGHQSYNRLAATGRKVVGTMSELRLFFEE